MGTVQVRDGQNLLSSGDVAAIAHAGASWPFETTVLVTSSASRDALEDAAHVALAEPHQVVIALDPGHHRVVARFGTASGVKPGDFDSISRAGNAHFHSGEYVAGIEAIGTRAEASAKATVAMTESNVPVVVEHGLSTGAWVGIGFLFAVVAGLVVWAWRRVKKNDVAMRDLRDEANEFRTRNIEESAWHAKFKDAQKPHVMQPSNPSVYGGPPSSTGPVTTTAGVLYASPAPAPVIVNQGGGGSSDGFLTGMLFERVLDEPRQVEVVRETRVVHDEGGAGSEYSSSSSSDDDSSSSSADAGGGSGDWGGGSSDWGGGGGSDGGGGGGDY